MRSTARLCPKALSPYAQALRQVALRGAVALGPSAKEMELEMHRRGGLPADYRPPVQGKWDDTVERWAYAWQFPAEEDHEDVTGAVEKNTEVMQRLLSFGERLLHASPSMTPMTGSQSTLYPVPASLPAAASASHNNSGTPRLTGGAMVDYDAVEASVVQLHETGLASPPPPAISAWGRGEQTPNGEASAASTLISAAQYSLETEIPVAYLDDQSECSNASKELSVIMEDAGLDYTEEGLTVVVAALARKHYAEAARAIFDFARQVGLGPNAELYKSLMKHPSANGDVNQAMAIIEEMKDNGVTPRIGNWHELIRTFYKARDYPAVSQIVDNMKMYANIEPNEVTFALQLQALGKDSSQMNSLAEAVQLFDQMENVYGYIASRPHYDAMMYALSHSPQPEMRLRCQELAQKMDLMGIPWNATTYLNLIRSAQVVGDIEAVEGYLAKMRDDRVPVGTMHLSWALHAHVQHLILLNYEEIKEKGTDPLTIWLDHMNVCFGVYELVVTRGWEMAVPLINALLRLCCQTTILAVEYLPSNPEAVGRFEQQANKLWSDTFDEWHLKKDTFSYECYLAMLAHQQRIDEAEKLFQQMVLQEDLVPSRRTYECMVFMHLSSGEEGGAARALHYLEAMEKAAIPIRPSLLKKIVRINNAAGYKRDMKRRARRIMQAREEHLARKEEGLTFNAAASAAVAEDAGVDEEGNPVLRPLPLPVHSTLAWWERWKAETVSKHELFDEEGVDGTPKGESFEEKNSALAKMGIESAFKQPGDVPALDKHRLLPKLRAEGEVTGSLWAMDGAEYSYPKDGGGPAGWGVRLWRERALLKKEFNNALDGKAAVPAFSELGNAVRVVGDQMDIEESGARTFGELADWRAFPEHRYEDGSAKPPSELAQAVPSSAEFVWQGEQRDPLAPYKSDAELALESDNTFYAEIEKDAGEKTRALVEVLQRKEENAVELTGRGPTRRSKYDYLEKWREMYRHGTLEAPEAPALRFGRTPDDHHDTMAATVRDWYARNRKALATPEQLARWTTEADRAEEQRVAKDALKGGRRRTSKQK